MMDQQYTQKENTIKMWAEDDRPREKLISQGARALSDSELLAIILRSGSNDENAIELARRILAKYGHNLYNLSCLSIDELCQFKGIGPAKAVSVITAFQLGKRALNQNQDDLVKIRSSSDAYSVVSPLIEDLSHEEFWVLYLNRANKIIDKFCLSSGGVAGTVVDSKMIFKRAVAKLASGIILAHNHPSGNLKPSQQDINVTKQLSKAAKLFDMRLLDHVIITSNSYYSFLDEGML